MLHYANIDLDDEAVAASEADVITAGVNGSLNPDTRVMFQYVPADAKDIDKGSVNVFEARAQIDF